MVEIFRNFAGRFMTIENLIGRRNASQMIPTFFPIAKRWHRIYTQVKITIILSYFPQND
jgi:hypothetical protein